MSVNYKPFFDSAESFQKAHESAVTDKDCKEFCEATKNLKKPFESLRQLGSSFAEMNMIRFGDKAEKKFKQVWDKRNQAPSRKKTTYEKASSDNKEVLLKELATAGKSYKDAFDSLKENPNYLNQKETKKTYQKEMRKLFKQDISGDKLQALLIANNISVKGSKSYEKVGQIFSKYPKG